MKVMLLRWAVVVLLAYFFVPWLFGANAYLMSLIVASLVIGGVALAWALLGNLGGMISFGHSAFFGVGAYVSALLAINADFPIWLAMVCGGIGALLVSVLMLPTLRLKGPYFAIAILAYAQIFRIIATEWRSLTNGVAGLSSIPSLPAVLWWESGSKTSSYLIVVTLVFAFILVYRWVANSHYGLALRAMHESEDATRVVGVNSTLLKAAMLLLSACMTGMIGAFNAHYINFLEPDYAFGGVWIVIPIVAAIFGGYRTIWGPLVGAVVVYLVDQLLFKNIFPSGHQIILGIILVVMILFSPGGLLPLLTVRTRKRTC